MKELSLYPSSGSLRVFVACLLAFTILITPIAAIAAPGIGSSPTVRKGSLSPASSNATEANKARSAAEELFVNPPTAMPAPEPAPEPLPPPVGAVTASMTAALTVTANNANGQADPGDTINYTVTLGNDSGSEATGLSFDDFIDPHTAFVDLSIKSTPVCRDQSVSTNEDTAKIITLEAQDPDNDPLTFSIVTPPLAANGTLGGVSGTSCTPAGLCSATVTFTPTPDYNGPASFTFRVNDGTANSNEVGTVSITVVGVNDAPTFTQQGGIPATPSPFNPPAVNEDSGAVSVPSFITAVKPGPVSDTNENGQTVSFVILPGLAGNSNPGLFLTQPALNVVGAAYPKTATLTYTPAANQNGTAIITYHAHDDGGTSPGVDNSADQTFTITVNAVNDPPVVVSPTQVTPFAVQANMKRTGLGGLLASVTDADSGVNLCTPTPFTIKAGSISATSPVAGGTISNVDLNAGTFDFDPPPGVTGAVTFTYIVKDNGCPGTADSAPVTVTFNVAGPVIWFVNLGAGVNGDGRLSSPFNILSSANTKLQNLGANERIFLYSTTAATTAAVGDVVLLQGTQGLIGQGAFGASFDALMGVIPPANTIARPSINGTRPTVRGTVTMKDNTVVRGVNIDVSAAAAGSKGLTALNLGVGSVLTISDVNVTSAGGNAVDFNNARTMTYTTSDSATSPNVLSSTSATALSVVNTTIGASGLTFRSISAGNNTAAADPVNGITLNNTGSSGKLIITGNAGLCTVATPTCTGGQIQNTTGDGILLTSTNNVSLTRIRINNNLGAGIRGTTLNGFKLDSGLITNNGNQASPDEPGVIVTGLTGTAIAGANPTSITNTIIKDNFEFQLQIINSSGTLTDLQMSGNTISSTGASGVIGDLVDFLGSGTSTMKLSVTSGTFTGAAPLTADGIFANSGGTSMTVNVTGATFTTNNAGVNLATNPVSTTLTFNISSNNFQFTRAPAINLFNNGNAPFTRTVNGNILNNTIGTDGVAISGSQVGNAITIGNEGAINTNLLISGNQIHQIGVGPGLGQTAINVLHGISSPTGGGTTNVTVTGNTIKNVLNGRGLIIAQNDFLPAGGNAGTVCADISGNTFAGTIAGQAGNGERIRVRRSSNATTSAFNVRQASSVALAAANTGVTNAQISVSGAVTFNGGDCADPPAPLLLAEGGILAALSAPSLVDSFLLAPLNTSAYRLSDVRPFGVEPPSRVATSLNQQQLDSIVTAAIQRWSVTGLTPQQVATLRGIKFDVADLEAAYLGESGGNHILVDRDAQGKGWFIDFTPQDDSEFGDALGTRRYTDPISAPAGHVDLLTALMHEMGHKLGLDDSYAEKDRDSLMYGYLTVGERRLPAKDQAASAIPGQYAGAHFLSLLPSVETPVSTARARLNSALEGEISRATIVEARATIEADSIYAGASAALYGARGVKSERGSSPRVSKGVEKEVRSQKSEVRGQRSEVRGQRSDVRLNHAKITRAAKANNRATASSLAPVVSGTFPINGTGSGFILPNSKTITITFSVTLNNPPNLAGPISPQVQNHGTLSGSFSNNPVDTNTVTTVVDLFDSTTTVTSLPTSSNTGQPVTFTAAIGTSGSPSGAGTNRTGTVNFKSDGTTIPGCGAQTVGAVTTNQATCTTSGLSTATPVGHVITAEYTGDGNFGPSNGTLSGGQVVTESGTTTTVTSSLNPSFFSQNVTFTATVVSATSVPGPPTGTVTFKDGGSAITCSNPAGQTLSSGVATCQISTLAAGVGNAPGNHSITAVYNAEDPNFTTSTGTLTASGPQLGDPQVVNKSDTATALISSKNPSSPGESVTFTATVTSSNLAVPGPPGVPGTVDFKDSVTSLSIPSCGAQALNISGVATCTTTSLSTASHTITADYSGDATFKTSTGGLTASGGQNGNPQVVSTLATTTALVSSQNPAAPAVTVTFTATVSTASGTPTGDVTFTSDGNPLVCDNGSTSVQPLSGNIATCDTNALTELGSPHGITAQYSGDTTFSGSTSNTVNQEITSCSASVVVTSALDDGSAGTLRTAISTGVCNNGTITFDTAGVFATPQTITLTTGELSISKSLTIDGPDAAVNHVTISGNNATRVFNLQPGKTATIRELTVSGGNSGGILNDHGTLTLVNMTISGNTAGQGGGVYNDGTNGGSATLTIINSTLSGNTAGAGGAVYSAGFSGGSATLNVINSTISGNNATSSGGGIISDGSGGSATLTTTNATITNNHADSDDTLGGNGGGLRVGLGTTTLRNTIVAGNFTGSGTSTPDDIFGSVDTSVASSYNLIGTGGTGGLTAINGNQINVANPGLGLLASNGGPTFTHSLLDASPAIDTGNSFALTTLAADIDNAIQTTIDVTNASAVPAGATIRVDSEQMVVTSKTANTLTVTRGANGTTAAAHADTTSVYAAFDQRGFPRTVNFDSIAPVPPYDDTDIGAYERQVTPGAPNAPDLDAASDTGTSSTDDITSDTSPTFTITGVTPGATVELLRDVSPGTGTPQIETATVAGTITPGTKQVETVTVTGGPVITSGNLLVKVTAAGINGGLPKNINVPVLVGNSAAVVAGNIKTALDDDLEVPNFFVVTTPSGSDVVLTRTVAAANDASLLVEIIGCGNTCTGITNSSSVNTTAGAAASAGTQQAETLTVNGTISGCSGSSSISLTVIASGMNNSGVPLSVAVTDTDTAAQVADKIFAFLATPAGADVTGFFNVTRDGVADLIFTKIDPAANDGTMKVSIANDTCSGLIAPFDSTPSATGAAPVAAANQVETVEILGAPVIADGNILVRVTAANVTGGTPKNYTVALLNGNDAATVAGKIKAVLDLDTDITNVFVVSTSSTEVILTAVAPAANDPSLLVQIFGCVNPPCTGISSSNSVNTLAGVAPGTGNATVTVTAAGMNNSPKTLSVAVVAGDDAAAVALKMRTALGADPDVSAFFTVLAGAAAEGIRLTAKTAAADDATLNIATNNGTSTGLTPAPTSANTTAGTAGPVVVASGIAAGTTIQLTDPGAAFGNYIYTARQIVSGTPRSPQSAALSVTISNASPVAPDTPNLQAGSDSFGPSGTNSDNITNITPRVFDVLITPEAGATLELLRNGTPVDSKPATTATVTLTDSVVLADAAYAYSARQTNAIGNSTSSAAALSVTIDTTPPAAPGTPDLQAASDGGNSDNITNAGSLSFDVAGTTSGVTVQLLRAGVVVASTAGTGGTVVLADSPSPADNVYAYTARQVDTAGNFAASSALNVTIDKTGTAAGIPDLKAASDSGVSSTDNITNVVSRSFDIPSTENGSLVEIYRGATFITSTTGNGGTVTLIDNSSPGDGPYAYTSRQTDIAGNVAPSSALNVTIDMTPNAPGTPDLQAASDTGTSDTDNITGNGTHSFDISAQSGDFVELLRNGVVVASTTATGASVTLDDTASLADAVYQYSARQTDVAGNIATSADLNVTIDATKPSVAMTSGVGNPTSATTIPVTATFSESVTDFISTDILVGNSGAPSSFAGGPAIYTFNLTPINPGAVTADIAAGVAMDAAGNTNTAATQFNRTFDPSALSASITPVSPDPRNTSVSSIQIVFNKAIQPADFTLADLSLKLGAVELLPGAATLTTLDNTTWTLGNLAGLTTGEGTYVLKLTALGSGIKDAANNLLTSDATETWVMDTTAPTVTVSLAVGQLNPVTGPTTSTVINFEVVFSESVTGSFINGDVNLSGAAVATVANVSGSGTTYNVAVEGMTSSGAVTITIPAAAATDAAGNGNTSVGPTNTATVTFFKDDFTTLEVNTTDDTDDGFCTALGSGPGANQDCTLREAINAANADAGAETITFAPALTSGGPATITLLTALSDITTDMTIQGPGAKLLKVERSSGAGRFRVFTISSGTVAISGLTISGGFTADGASFGLPGDDGGGILNAGALNLTDVTVNGNKTGAGHGSGGLGSDGGDGGGIYNNLGTLVLTNSTVSGNTTGDGAGPSFGGNGGGIGNTGTLTVTNSTISGNNTGTGGAGFVGGGGIYNNGGTLNVSSSTITLNHANGASSRGGGIFKLGAGTVTLKNTIVGGGNSALTGPDINGAVNSEGYNLIQSTSGATITETLNPGTNITTFDPQLFPLADNGGPTRTHSPQCTSPAIDKGKNFSLTTDQRGGVRPFDLADSVYPNAAGGGGSDIGAYETQTGGGCLPLAVAPVPAPATNEDTPVVITLKGTYSQNFALTFAITQQPANGSALAPTGTTCTFTTFTECTATVSYTPSLNFNGSDSFRFKVSASGLDSEEADVNITVNPVNDAPVANADVLSNVAEDSGTLTIPFADLLANDAAGPANENSQTLTIISVSNPVGGAVNIVGTDVLFAPIANYFGPASFQYKIQDNGTPPLDSVAAAIVVFNITPVADTPTVTNATTNINTQTTSGLAISRNAADSTEVTHFKITNITNGTLFRNDGTTQINNDDFITVAGGNAGLKFTPANNLVSPSSTFSFQVQSSLNNTDAGLGGSTATATITVNCGAANVVSNTNDSGAGSLRDAIADACPGSTITFNLAAGPQTITLGSELFISRDLTITGPTTPLTLSGGGVSRVFSVATGFAVNISNLTIANGQANVGGGIYNLGNLTISNSTFTGNHAVGGAGEGGAIDSEGGTLTIVNTTISGNTAETDGGGLLSGGNSTTTLIDVTITNNYADSDNNGSGQGGGIGQVSSNALTLHNTIVAGNFNEDGATDAPNDVFVNLAPPSAINPLSSHNLIGVDTGLTGISDGDANGNHVGTAATPINARLGPLGPNGGPTQTHTLLAGSPALDAGDNTFVTNPPFSGPPFTDQRGTGFSRIVDGPDADTTAIVDIGAFEAQVSVEDITDKTTNEDTQLQFSFNVGGSASITSVTATSGNTTLVPNNAANIALSGAGSTRTLTINPAANQFGTSTITVTVNGNNSQSMTDTFELTVNSVNDVPSFTKGADQTVSENAGAQTVNNWATNISTGPANESSQTLTFQVTNNTNTGLFSAGPAISPTGVLTYTPATNVSGTASITVVLQDNGGTANSGVDTSAPQTFNITVNEGGTIQFSSGTYSVPENAANVTITITRTGGSAGTATVIFATSDGTATAADYTSVPQIVTFSDGELSKTVDVAITDDFVQEPNETVNLTLGGVGGSSQLGAPTTAVLTITNDDGGSGIIRFTWALYNTTESSGSTTITVERLGDTSQPATVDYATSDDSSSPTVVPCSTINGIASSRCDFTTALGTLNFAPGETSKSFTVLISQDNYLEGQEFLTLTLSNVTGGAVFAAPSTATLTITDDASEPAANPVDDAQVFVGQQYHDFLNREADTAGLAFWTDEITSCGADAQCIEIKRINVSAAFFLSIEFQESGNFVRNFYVAALNRPNNMPRFLEFMRDTQAIQRGVIVDSNNNDWQAVLDANKQVFMNDFVTRAEFVGLYPTTDTPNQYVDKLYLHAGVVPAAAERQAAIDEFAGAATAANSGARGRALKRITGNADFRQREINRSFVQMQYFGFLRRNPDDQPDGNFNGYDFWLNKLNQFNGNFIQAEMVKAFIISAEYRRRFGP